MKNLRLLTVTLCVLAMLTTATAAERPNVLFVLTEDQGSHLSFLGTPGLQTPNMDAIAKSGVYFKNGFVAYPVCSASKAACYTGLHCHTNGILNNTYNFHKPASQVTPGEKNMPLSKNNHVIDSVLTLPEILKANGYYQGVTHKLHVLPNEKFPYDEFMNGGKPEIVNFIQNAKKKDQPWFLLVNIPNSHRPYPNSDKETIRVNPDDVAIPKYLPDSPAIRKDWAEYLAGIEEADALTGQAIDAVEKAGQLDNTIVIFMGDHGPTFQHGKMTLYDLGLRVPFMISGPGVQEGVQTDALASGLDITPTVLDCIDSASDQPVVIPGNESAPGSALETVQSFNSKLHGISLLPTLRGEEGAMGHEMIFAEISNRGPLPNDGIQERSVFDGRFKLIIRQNVDKAWRQVNADSRMFKTWGNRTYRETIRLKEEYPVQYRILAEMDPQELGGSVPEIELYDLQNDPNEMQNLVGNSVYASHLQGLKSALRKWVIDTDDESFSPDLIMSAANN